MNRETKKWLLKNNTKFVTISRVAKHDFSEMKETENEIRVNTNKQW